MHLYLAALDVFAIIALMLATRPVPEQTQRARYQLLLALISLVILRSLALSVSLIPAGRESAAAARRLDSLEVLATIAIVWALANPTLLRRTLLQRYLGLALGIGVLLALLVLLPAWPIPWPATALIVLIGGLPFVIRQDGSIHLGRALVPGVLGVAALLTWFKLTELGRFLNLLANGALLYTLYTEFAFSLDIRQRKVESLNAQTTRQSQEQQRIRRVAERLSAAFEPGQSLEDVLALLVHATGADQAAIFMLDQKAGQQLHLTALRRSDQAGERQIVEKNGLALADVPLLNDTIAGRRPLILPAETGNGLAGLFNLWGETRLGPALIQPLLAQEGPLGALLLGNPDSQRPIPAFNLRLCQTLAPQLATILKSRYYCLDLKSTLVTVTTHLRQRDNELRQIRAIVETIDDGVVISNTSGRVILVNRAAERILGRTRNELLHQPIGTIYGDIDSRLSIEELAVDFSRRSKPIPTYFEREGVAVKGQLIPLRNDKREAIGIVALLRDVTREVNADRAKSDFVFTISRELRNPLTSVKGYAELMASGATGEMSEQQVYFLEKIRANTDRIAELVENSLEATERDLNTTRLDIHIIDPTSIINEAMRQVSSLAESRNIELSLEVAANLPRLQADPTRFKQILDNLLSNACRFTPEGGRVALRAWLQEEGVGNNRTKVLIIAVIDTGVGIPPAQQSRIFGRFYQADNPLSAEAGGVGMGLAIVKELVEAHGGRVWVESLEGEGSIFQVAFPLPYEAAQ
ncbi:MAG: ATP-binding protein [Anaerolineae bacterium]